MRKIFLLSFVLCILMFAAGCKTAPAEKEKEPEVSAAAMEPANGGVPIQPMTPSDAEKSDSDAHLSTAQPSEADKNSATPIPAQPKEKPSTQVASSRPVTRAVAGGGGGGGGSARARSGAIVAQVIPTQRVGATRQGKAVTPKSNAAGNNTAVKTDSGKTSSAQQQAAAKAEADKKAAAAKEAAEKKAALAKAEAEKKAAAKAEADKKAAAAKEAAERKAALAKAEAEKKAAAKAEADRKAAAAKAAAEKKAALAKAEAEKKAAAKAEADRKAAAAKETAERKAALAKAEAEKKAAAKAEADKKAAAAKEAAEKKAALAKAEAEKKAAAKAEADRKAAAAKEAAERKAALAKAEAEKKAAAKAEADKKAAAAKEAAEKKAALAKAEAEKKAAAKAEADRKAAAAKEAAEKKAALAKAEAEKKAAAKAEADRKAAAAKEAAEKKAALAKAEAEKKAAAYKASAQIVDVSWMIEQADASFVSKQYKGVGKMFVTILARYTGELTEKDFQEAFFASPIDIWSLNAANAKNLIENDKQNKLLMLKHLAAGEGEGSVALGKWFVSITLAGQKPFEKELNVTGISGQKIADTTDMKGDERKKSIVTVVPVAKTADEQQALSFPTIYSVSRDADTIEIIFSVNDARVTNAYVYFDVPGEEYYRDSGSMIDATGKPINGCRSFSTDGKKCQYVLRKDASNQDWFGKATRCFLVVADVNRIASPWEERHRTISAVAPVSK